MRSFLAVTIPESERESLAAAISGFKQANLPVKWVEPPNLHITVKFLGDIGQSVVAGVQPACRDICRAFKPFEISLRGIGCFPRHGNARVIWVGVDRGAGELTALVSALDSALHAIGFEQDSRFHPHLTIGRVRKPACIDRILKTEFLGRIFRVDNIVLYRSTLTAAGPTYTVLDTIALTGA